MPVLSITPTKMSDDVENRSNATGCAPGEKRFVCVNFQEGKRSCLVCRKRPGMNRANHEDRVACGTANHNNWKSDANHAIID